jgi:hypothetical protein
MKIGMNVVSFGVALCTALIMVAAAELAGPGPAMTIGIVGGLFSFPQYGGRPRPPCASAVGHAQGWRFESIWAASER